MGWSAPLESNYWYPLTLPEVNDPVDDPQTPSPTPNSHMSYDCVVLPYKDREQFRHLTDVLKELPKIRPVEFME